MRLFRRLISFLIALLLIVPTWAVVKTWYSATHETIRKADAIVVMGAAQLDGRPGEVLTARLTEAKRIFDRDFAPRIFTLGAGAPGVALGHPARRQAHASHRFQPIWRD